MNKFYSNDANNFAPRYNQNDDEDEAFFVAKDYGNSDDEYSVSGEQYYGTIYAT